MASALAHSLRGSSLRIGSEASLDRRLQHARQIVGAFDIAGEPIEALGGAAQHSITQVSLVPPPWLEFTTSDPSRSATRVRPPGTIRTPLAPVGAEGRRST